MLAELVLIVVGVLIALGVDSLAQEREDQETELTYLSLLAEDLERDTAEIGGWSSRIPGVIDALTLLAEGGPQPSTRADAETFVAAIWLTTSANTNLAQRLLTTSTFDDLVNTGNMRLIHDVSLRRAITDYYGRAERRSTGFGRQEFSTSYNETVLPLIPAAYQAELSGTLFGKPATAPAAEAVARRLLASLRARDAARLEVSRAHFRLGVAQEIASTAATLLERLERHVENPG